MMESGNQGAGGRSVAPQSLQKIEPLSAEEPQCVQVNPWVALFIGQHSTLEPVVNPIVSVIRRLASLRFFFVKIGDFEC